MGGAAQLPQGADHVYELRFRFFRDAQGYYLEKEDLKEYLRRINGQEPQSFLLAEGGIVYRVGLLAEAEGAHRLLFLK